MRTVLNRVRRRWSSQPEQADDVFAALKTSIEAGKKAEAFKRAGHYDYALDIIETFSDARLHALRSARDDEDRERESLIRWQTAEDLLELFQTTVETRIAERRDAMVELVRIRSAETHEKSAEAILREEELREKIT